MRGTDRVVHLGADDAWDVGTLGTAGLVSACSGGTRVQW